MICGISRPPAFGRAHQDGAGVRRVAPADAASRLLLAVALAAPGTALAQRASAPDDFLGLTRCEDGRAVTQLRPDVRDSLTIAQLMAHEAVHRAQAARFPTCEAFMRSLGSARRIIEVELPAYCAQWRVAVRQGADPDSTRREFGWRIAAQSGAMENRLDIIERFRRECPDRPGPDPRIERVDFAAPHSTSR